MYHSTRQATARTSASASASANAALLGIARSAAVGCEEEPVSFVRVPGAVILALLARLGRVQERLGIDATAIAIPHSDR